MSQQPYNIVGIVDLDSDPEIEDDPPSRDTPTSSISVQSNTNSNSPPKKKSNRRKAKLLIRNDDNISFETHLGDKTIDSNSKEKLSIELRSQLRKMMAQNPNFESVQRVAFLRACVNYMLKVKDLDVYDFNSMGTITLPKLVNRFNEITQSDVNIDNKSPIMNETQNDITVNNDQQNDIAIKKEDEDYTTLNNEAENDVIIHNEPEIETIGLSD